MSAAVRAARDPAAPDRNARPRRRAEDDAEQHTRRVGDSDKQPLGPGSGRVTSAEAGIAAWRQRAAALIDEARAALDAGDLTEAVTAAEGALHEADEAPPPGIVEVIEPARPLLARVFAAYVGPLGGVPVLAPRAAEIARVRLGERGAGAHRAHRRRAHAGRAVRRLGRRLDRRAPDRRARLIRAGAVRII